MVFSSFAFIFYFLPISLGIYYCTPRRYRNCVLLCLSLIYYGWGAPNFFALFLLFALADYLFAASIAFLRNTSPGPARMVLIASISANVLALAYYKYSTFFISELNQLLQSDLFVPQAVGSAAGAAVIPWTKIALPLGISFFTFHKISYVVDVYRGVSAPARSLIDYLLYITFFPQLIAGPIIRYHDIDRQIESRQVDATLFYEGISRFIIGLCKKILIADVLAGPAHALFANTNQPFSPTDAWVGVICYAFQIYFDFSGYSDMAIGLALMFGFRFMENFNHPYAATSFTDFWRRWHISLSRWMRDYLYLPLGGNRVSEFRAYLNLWIVFLVSGLWHGASYNFILWGAYHGLFLSLDKLLAKRAVSFRLLRKIPRPFYVAVCFFFILLSWVLFRAPDLHSAGSIYARMLAPWNYVEVAASTVLPRLSNQVLFTLFVAACMSFAPALSRTTATDLNLKPNSAGNIAATSWLQSAWQRHLAPIVMICLLLCSVAMMASVTFSPFIYFNF